MLTRSGSGPLTAALLGVTLLLVQQVMSQTRPTTAPIGRPESQMVPATNQTAQPSAHPSVEQPDQDTSASFIGNLLTRDELLDDPFGVHSALANHGLTIAPSYTVDFGKNFRGGVDTDGSTIQRLFNLALTLDTKKAFKLNGGTFFVHFQDQHGRSLSDKVGDIQGLDNIDAHGRTQLAEIYYTQSLLNDKLLVRLGKIDANSDFAVVNNGTGFIDSSFGHSPTIIGLPTYPDPAFGAEVFVTPNKNLYMQGGIFDGAGQEGIETGDKGLVTLFGKPAALFVIGEGGFKWDGGASGRSGRMGFGYSDATGHLDRFDGGIDRGSGGPYMLFDQTLIRKHPDKTGDSQGLGVFLQYGYAAAAVGAIDHYAGIGIVNTGTFPTRDQDAVG